MRRAGARIPDSPRRLPACAAAQLASEPACVDRLGVGTFGKVRLVRDKKTSRIFAMKIISKSKVLQFNQQVRPHACLGRGAKQRHTPHARRPHG